MSERREFVTSLLREPIKYVRDLLRSPVTYARQLREKRQISGNGTFRDASIGVLSISAILLPPSLFLTGIVTQDPEVLRLGSALTAIDATVVITAILLSRNRNNPYTLQPS